MNFNQQAPFDWTRFWDVIDDNVRANIATENGQSRGNGRASRPARPDEFAEYWANAMRNFGAPWMNFPLHGGPPHRGPHPPPPGRSGPPPPPPPPGHAGPPPPPPGPHSPPPPPEQDEPVDPPSRAPTPPTPVTPPEELPEYPGLPHEHPHDGPRGPHRHGHCHRREKGKGPEHTHNTDKSGESSHPHPHPHHRGPHHGPNPWDEGFFGRYPGRRGRRNPGGFGGPRGNRFPFGDPEQWKSMFPNGIFNEYTDKKTTNNDSFTPQYEVYDKSDKVVIFVSLAGAKKENVDVAYEAGGHSLTISGVVTRPEEVDEEMFALRKEGNRDVGYFNVKVELPTFWGVVEDIKAKMEDGVLRVEVAKPADEDWEEVRKVRVE